MNYAPVLCNIVKKEGNILRQLQKSTIMEKAVFPSYYIEIRLLYGETKTEYYEYSFEKRKRIIRRKPMKIKKITTLFLSGFIAASFLLSGCQKQLNANDTIATLNGTAIKVDLANFMAQFQAVTYDSYYASTLGSNMWDQDLSGKGQSLQEEVKADILDQIETDYLLEKHMSDYNVSISEDEKKAISEAAKKFMNDNSAVGIKQMGATEDVVKEMLRLHTIETKMKAAIIATSDVSVTDEEAAQRTFSYYQITLPTTTATDGTTGTESSGTSTSKKTTSTEKAKSTESATQQAEALKSYAQTVADAAKTDFDGIATKYTLTKNTHSYGKDESSDSFDQTVLKAADGLTDNQVSDLIETSSKTYYVIRLDSSYDASATATKKQELLTTKQNDYYDSICKKYKKAAKWNIDKKVLSEITFKGNTYTIETPSTQTSTESTTESLQDSTQN